MIRKLKRWIIQFFAKHKLPFYGGILTALFTGFAVYLIGSLSGHEAIYLIESSMPRITTLFNTIIIASSTILALILTLLGISSGSDTKLKKQHYKQVLDLAWFVSFLFITTLIFFQLFNIPYTETEGLPTGIFNIIYWIIMFTSSLISGMMVAVILMLYSTINNIIRIVGLGEDNILTYDDKEENEANHQQN